MDLQAHLTKIAYNALALCSFMIFPIISQQIPLQAEYVIDSNWGSGYNAHIVITNNSSSIANSWTADFDLPQGQNLSCLWNGIFEKTGQHIHIINDINSNPLAPGKKIVLGFGVENQEQSTPQLIGLEAKGFTSDSQPQPDPEIPPCAFLLDAQYTIDSAWQSGYQLTIHLKNSTSQQGQTWSITFDLPEGQTISSLWNGSYSINGSKVTITNPVWSGAGVLTPGATASVGMVIAINGNSTPGISFLTAIANISAIDCIPSIPVPQPPVLDPIVINPSSPRDYTIQWHSVALADEYQLEQSTSENFDNKIIILKDITLSKIIQNQPNGTYYYRVAAANASGLGGYSTVQSVTINIPLPTSLDAPVINQIINPDGKPQYTLSWNAVTDALSYQIEESTTSDFLNITTILTSATSYNFTGKALGSYFYRVKALADSVVSPASTSVSVTVTQQPHNTSHKVIGYYTNWAIYRSPGFYPKDINANLVTHINYAFLRSDSAGNVTLFDSWADVEYRSDWNTQKPYWGNFRQLYDLKQQYPHLKTLISVGGWTLSDTFSAMASNAAARANFIRQCIQMCEKYNFDGIDLDWEYPGFVDHNGHPEDKQNFTLLLQELYQAAKAHSPALLVTIAAPAGSNHYLNMEVSIIHQYLDWINLMTYDFAGPLPGWSPVTNHHAPLHQPAQGEAQWNVADAVAYYLSQGVPSEKLVVGIPLYGRSFANVQSTTDGLFAAYNGAGQGTTSEAGVRFFSDIKNNLLKTYKRYWDNKAQAPYLFNPALREFVTYDDEESITLKTEFIKQNNLGGAMVWELGLDTIQWHAMSALNNGLKS